MDKLHKNIQQLVANKVLNDIGKIVEKENTKEKIQNSWAKLVMFVISLSLIVLLILNAV